uniref:Glycosyltransferase family 92 protein n=1 Tax=Macrostomum lignano TaxID=282301 RepID=A0A1I8IAL4_9PLAT
LIRQVSDPICSVLITDGPEPIRDLDGRPVSSVELPVLTVPREIPTNALPTASAISPRQFTVCVPPLFGSPSERKLLDFVEMSRALGAEHFVFYLTDEIYSNNGVLLKLLTSYASRGLATLFHWKPVNEFRSQIHYHGQVLAVHHCLYWNMGLSKYAVFQDFDELLVPNSAKYKSWTDLAKDIDDGTHCGFSAFFEPDQSYFDAKRTAGVSRVRTKCMVKPDLIFEMGIHHISKQNIEEMTPENKEPDVALLHHYSRCTMAFDNGAGDLCSKYIADTELHFWRKQFEKFKLETVHALNSSS